YNVSKSVATSLALAAPSPASVSFGSTGSVTFSATLTRTTGGAVVSGATVNFTVDGNAAGSATTVSGVATFSTYDPSALSVGSHNIQASFAGATISGSTYTASSGTQTVTVSTAGQTITFGALANKTYGDAPFTVSATGGASGEPVTFTASPSSVCTASGTNGTTIAIIGAGSCTVTAHQPGNTNYNAATDVPQSFTVAQATPTVSFTGAPTNAYYGAQFAVTATTSSAAVPTITASGACTISGATVTMTSGVGICSLQANWPADANYLAAMANQSTNALPALVSVTVPDTTVTYDGSPHAVTPTVTPAVSYALTYIGVSPTVYPTTGSAPTEPGTYTVVATVTDPNYSGSKSGTLTIQQKDAALTLVIHTGTPAPTTTYGYRVYFDLTTANSPCPTGQVQFFVDSQPVSTATLGDCTQAIQFSTATLTPGTHTVYATYAGDTYYVSGQSGTVSHDVTADGTNVTLATSAMTAYVGDSITFTATVTPANAVDSSATAPSGTVSFYDNGSDLLGSAPLTGTTATFSTTSLPYGSHSVTATYASNDGLFTGNSSPVSVETVNQITPTITWPNPGDIVYGTALSDTQLNATASDHHNGGNNVKGTFSYNPPASTVLLVGQLNLSVTFRPEDTATYAGTSATATINITPATLTVTADDASRAYGANNPSFTFQYSGFVNNETSAVVTTAPTCTTTATPSSNVGKYSITCAGGVSANYTFKYVDGTLTVNPAPVTATAGSYNGVYDGSAHSPSPACEMTGTFTGDLTCANSPASVGPNVSSGDVNPVVSGTGLSNFAVTSVKGSYSITPLTVTVTGGNYTGVYDGSTHSPSACVSSYAGVSCTNNPSLVGPDVGGAPVAPVASVASGIAADYDIKTVNGAWSITPLGMTLTAGSYGPAAYD
ncbi:MAG: hypothetical protein DMG88_18460, partial [Acidobacteria bacterium]